MPEPIWRNVINLHQAKGRSRADAINLVIIEWLAKGDTEPLLWAIGEGEITDPVLSVIAAMLIGAPGLPYHLAVHRQPGQLGAPEKPGILWRDWFAALAYEKRCKVIGSEKAFDETADKFGISASAIRSALRRIRKLRKTPEAPTTIKS